MCDTNDSHVNLLVFVAYESVLLSNLLQTDKKLCRAMFYTASWFKAVEDERWKHNPENPKANHNEICACYPK